MGRNVHDYDDAPHLVNEFPFDQANRVFEQFDEAFEARFGERVDPIEFEFDGYDGAYFEALCERVLASQRQGMGHVIQSVGTLGGGNHFVEFGRARDSGEHWLVVHSGSRYLGKSVAEYWQGTASDRRNVEAHPRGDSRRLPRLSEVRPRVRRGPRPLRVGHRRQGRVPHQEAAGPRRLRGQRH